MQDKNRVGLKRKCSVAGEVYYAYIPKPLPPKPRLELDKLFPLLDQANTALGRLEGMSMILRAALQNIYNITYTFRIIF